MLKLGSKAPVDWTVEVFDARLWPEQPEADAGLYRLRVGGRWVNEAKRSHTFFTAAGLAALLTRELTTPGALEDMDADMPDLRKGQYVRWRPSDDAHAALYGHSLKTKAGSDPIACRDGQWRIMVNGNLVCCDEVQGLDKYGREIPAALKEAV